ncbi:unnamed protein product [Meloidogyne enterolobii]|uniref:Uncharacterized protein n=2 Tax=Meloidogyne enterolobii TaxID=390850 RepID=A0ACB1AFI6_MELEN
MAIDDLSHCLTYSEPFQLPKFIFALKQFWTDPALHRQVLPKLGQFHMQESLPHFFNSIDRISQSNYVPTIQDILLLRVPTSGIVEVQFNVNRFPFRVFDVGGQRNERRKWIHCFDNVQAIIFVAAVSEFDQTLEEDENTVKTPSKNFKIFLKNRLIESLHLFKSICMAKWFINTGMILFLNKTDLFEQKIAGKKSIKQLFPSYSGWKLKILNSRRDKFLKILLVHSIENKIFYKIKKELNLQINFKNNYGQKTIKNTQKCQFFDYNFFMY